MWGWYASQHGDPNTHIVADSVGFSFIVGSRWNVDNSLSTALTTYSTWVPFAIDMHTYPPIDPSWTSWGFPSDYFPYAVQSTANWPTILKQRPWIIGETQYNTQFGAEDLARGIALSNKTVLFVVQWPTQSTASNGNDYWYNAPLNFSYWINSGF